MLPASAGMILVGDGAGAGDLRAPRIRRDDPANGTPIYVPSLCSPHPRG